MWSEVSLTRGGGSRKSPAMDLYKYLYKFLFPYHFLSLPILPRSIVLLVLHNAMPPPEDSRGQGVLQDKWSIVLGHEALCYFKILVFGTLHFKNFKFFQIMITSSECSRPVRFFCAKFSILGKLVNEL